jgi:hypothetical protein
MEEFLYMVPMKWKEMLVEFFSQTVTLFKKFELLWGGGG